MDLKKDSPYFRICPQCGTEFMANHMARKFCDRKKPKCHDAFHNERKKPKRNKTKELVEIHYRNWQILNELYNLGRIEVTQKELGEKGFKITYCVERKRRHGSESFDLIYLDYSLTIIDEKILKIIKNE